MYICFLFCVLCKVAVHEQHYCPAGTAYIWLKRAVVISDGYAVFDCPFDCRLLAVGNLGGILKDAQVAVCCRLALVAPEEGYELRTAYLVVGLEVS